MTSASERYRGERRSLSDRRQRPRPMAVSHARRANGERRRIRLPACDLTPLLPPLGFVMFFMVMIGFLMLMGAMD